MQCYNSLQQIAAIYNNSPKKFPNVAEMYDCLVLSKHVYSWEVLRPKGAIFIFGVQVRQIGPLLNGNAELTN